MLDRAAVFVLVHFILKLYPICSRWNCFITLKQRDKFGVWDVLCCQWSLLLKLPLLGTTAVSVLWDRHAPWTSGSWQCSRCWPQCDLPPWRDVFWEGARPVSWLGQAVAVRGVQTPSSGWWWQHSKSEVAEVLPGTRKLALGLTYFWHHLVPSSHGAEESKEKKLTGPWSPGRWVKVEGLASGGVADHRAMQDSSICGEVFMYGKLLMTYLYHV